VRAGRVGARHHDVRRHAGLPDPPDPGAEAAGRARPAPALTARAVAASHRTPATSRSGGGSDGASTGAALLRELVRREVVGRQLSAHLPSAPARVLDVGSGPRTAALALARAGHRAVVVEPDERVRIAVL